MRVCGGDRVFNDSRHPPINLIMLTKRLNGRIFASSNLMPPLAFAVVYLDSKPLVLT